MRGRQIRLWLLIAAVSVGASLLPYPGSGGRAPAPPSTTSSGYAGSAIAAPLDSDY